MTTDFEQVTEPRHGVITGILKVIRLLLGTLILFGVVINFSNVVARYVFFSPLVWAEAIITFGLIWCVFLGVVLVTWDERHLRIDIVSLAAPTWFRTTAKVAEMICMLFMASLIATQSFQVTMMMIRNDQRTAVEDLPLSVPHSALMVGFVLIAIVALSKIAVMARRAINPRISKHPSSSPTEPN